MDVKKLKPSESKSLRENFVPSFQSESFELVCPKMDSSIARNLKEIKSEDRSKVSEVLKVESKEKLLLANQYKILDVSRPLLFMWDCIKKDPVLASSIYSHLRWRTQHKRQFNCWDTRSTP